MPLKILILSFFICNNVIGQNKSLQFIINGKINTNSGHLEISPGFITKEFSSCKIFNAIIELKDSSFQIKGVLNSSQGLRFNYEINEVSKISPLIVIYPGTQEIQLSVDSNNLTIKKISPKHNQVDFDLFMNFMKESREREEKFYNYSRTFNFKGLSDREIDSIKSSMIKMRFENEKFKDTLLRNFISKNPRSLIGLWSLVENVSTWGYKKIQNEIYTLVNDALKNSFPGNMIGRKLDQLKTTSIGGLFSGFKFKNLKQKDILIDTIINRHKIILIDFWYSYCGPCIRQFEHYKRLYKKYSKSGFEIINISTDEIKDFSNLKLIINKYKLPWIQLWDKNSKLANKLSIHKFPTNFLLNEKMEIIEKDISINDLEEYLKKNIGDELPKK